MAGTILLIDSDTSHANALKTYLSRKYPEVLIAASADQLNQALAGHRVDIILADPYSIGGTFPETLKAMKASWPALPLIIFSQREYLDQAMDDFGTLAIQYLEIPLNTKALGLAIKNAQTHIANERRLANYAERLSDLDAAQILYYQLFNEVPCYITVQNRDLRLTDTNLMFKKDFGDEVGGYCYEVYKHRSSPCPECPVAKTFQDGQSHGTEEVVRSKSGQQYNVITQTAPIRDEDGEITQVMEISTNITKIRQLQDHLSSLGLMLGSISHGIKGMLTSLDGSIYHLETGFQKQDDRRIEKGFWQIKKVSEGIKKMVLDILNYAKSRELQYQPVKISDMITDAVATVTKQASDNNVAIETCIADDLDTVEVDPNWMQTSLVNFLENAVDACVFDVGKTDHRIGVSAYPDGDNRLCLKIADNGIGMDEETRDALFSLFFSSKGAKGTGLGLFIANHVIEQHGGRINVESRLGQGTCFEIVLPQTRAERRGTGIFSKGYKRVCY
ncbi:MAG: ATP-binding protein [Thermodesulfobacteriota bacterium]|nr:ATP-binding protein [Thermodesulfobacteriota bacterium]